MRWFTAAAIFFLPVLSVLPAEAQSVPAAFLLYPNYRGLIFDDRPEIAVEAPAGSTVTVSDGDTGAPVLTATVPPAARTVTIAAGGLTAGHPYRVTVSSGGTTLEVWDVTAAPASMRASMNISFDPQGRLLMHGQPTFVLGVYDSGLPYYNDVASYEQMLFAPGGRRQLGGVPLNMYLNYHYGEAPMSAMQPLMDALRAHGVMYLQTANCFDDGSYTRIPFAVDQSDSYVTQFGAHPAAAGYYIMDECVDGLVPETVTHHTRLRGLDPDSMTLATTLARGYIDPRKWTEAADVLASDPYPLYGTEPAQGYAHFTVADYVAQAAAAVRGTRPALGVLQFFKFTTDSRWPSVAEQRAHAIMSIVEGARGIFWWEIGANGLQRADASTIATQMQNLQRLVSELAALNAVLVADDAPGALVGNSSLYADPVAGRQAQLEHNIATAWLYSDKQWYQAELDRLRAGDLSLSPMLPGAATIRTRVKLAGGKGYVFAYNYTNASTPVTFTWNTAPGSVTENGSGASYPLAGNSWSDTFGPYESRIYVVANGGSAGPPPSPPPTALAVSFVNPAAGATVSGTTTVTMAPAGTGFTYSLAVGGARVYTGTNASVGWNTTAVPDGLHTLTATVSDASGSSGTASLTVNVQNAVAPGFTASFQYPAAGATVSGAQTVGLATTAPWGTSKTWTLSVDGTVLLTATNTGTTLWYTWDTTRTANGDRTLTLAVRGSDGASATATLPVTVANAGSPPLPSPLTVAFTAPEAGATVSGTTLVGVSASGATGDCTFVLAVDGVTHATATVTGSSASLAWDTTGIADADHTLAVTVTDGGGATATASRSVKVANAVAPPPGPTASFVSPSAGATVTGKQSVQMAASESWTGSKTWTLALDGKMLTRVKTTASSRTYVWDTTRTTTGTHTLTLTIVDASGVTATATLPVTVRR